MRVLPLSDERVVKLFLAGSVAVIPTDTVYGLVCRAADNAAVERLYDIKKRDGKPGTVIAADIDQLVRLGLKRRYLTAFQQFWPGGVSAVIPCGPELQTLHQGKFGLAVRVVGDVALSAVLRQCGPLLTTSANMPGQPTCKNVESAGRVFGEQVDFYVDGGPRTDSKPSTVVRMVDDALEVLRQGAVNVHEVS